MAISALKDIKDGEECYNNYGAKGNNVLWLSYGFVVPDNPNEMISLPFDLNPEDRMYEDKLSMLKKKTSPHNHCTLKMKIDLEFLTICLPFARFVANKYLTFEHLTEFREEVLKEETANSATYDPYVKY